MKRKKKPKKKIMSVPLDSVRSGAIAHTALTGDQMRRIRAIWERTQEYGPWPTLEQCELSFMRDSKPENEIAVWEKMADAVEEAARETSLDPTITFDTVLSFSTGSIKAGERTKTPVKEIVAVCRRVGLVPTPLQIRKR